MIRCCRRCCSLLNLFAMFLASSIPWCHAFAALPRRALLLPRFKCNTTGAGMTIGHGRPVCLLLRAGSTDKDIDNNMDMNAEEEGSSSVWSSGGSNSNTNGSRDYTHHKRPPSQENPQSQQQQSVDDSDGGDWMNQAQMEFLMNDIQSPITPPPTSSSVGTNTDTPGTNGSNNGVTLQQQPLSSSSTQEEPSKSTTSSLFNNKKPQSTTLTSSTNNPKDTPCTTVQVPENTDNNNNDNAVPRRLIQLDRAAIRLDGLEVYAVVSALTLATSIQFFELLSPQWNWSAHKSLLGLALDLVAIGASATGMITGLHSTFIFSLMTVYGRTAVGMGWDESFSKFFHKTEEVRSRGFRSFRISLYTFLVQILFIIVSRLPPSRWLRQVGTAIMACVMVRVVYGDTKLIIDRAGIMLFEGHSMHQSCTGEEEDSPDGIAKKETDCQEKER